MPDSPVAYAFQPADPLGEALHSMRLAETFCCRCELSAPWGIDLPPMPGYLLFHAITEGTCEVEFEDGDRHLLRAGDFALVPHGLGHLLRSDPQAATEELFSLERELLRPRYEILRHGGGGASCRAICGAVSAAGPTVEGIVELLPRLLVLRADSPQQEWLLGTLRFMAREAQSLHPGGDTVISRLADILVIQTIRAWLQDDPAAQEGWLGALQDPRLGRALALVHRCPAEPWTVEALAEAAGLSRSTFSARFTGKVGKSPLHYVRQWRFRLARDWLRDTDMSIAEIADELGYNSEAAFNRAYKQFTGQPPGAVRRKADQS